MRKGYMYILKCSDGSYYTGSTTNLELRFAQHQSGKGANHTKKRLPVELVYYEHYERIDQAFFREKQVQGWSRKKKEALINGKPELLPELAVAYRDKKDEGDGSSASPSQTSASPSQTSASPSNNENETEAEAETETETEAETEA